MAIYSNPAILKSSTDAAFTAVHNPGFNAPYSGIYRCDGCSFEVASNQGQPLPPQNHHQHSSAQGMVRWRLAVFAEHKN